MRPVFISLSQTRKHDGARMPRWEYNGDLNNAHPEEILEKRIEQGKNLKNKTSESLPPLMHKDEEHLNVRKKIWKGRRERDGAPKRHRTTLPVSGRLSSLDEEE